jgi:uncharacterized protein YfdQ (DUF2303 family)
MGIKDDEQVYGDMEAVVGAGLGMAVAADRVVVIGDSENDPLGIPLAIIPKDFRVEALTEADKARAYRRDRPLRVEANTTILELESFIAICQRFKRPVSAIFADIEATKLTAIFDFHDPTGDKDDAEIARWGKHRAIYVCPRSKPWQAWTALDGKPLSQDQFAQFIEERLDDLTSAPADRAPPEDGVTREYGAPARILDMARNLQIRTRGEFVREIDTRTGSFNLVNRVQNEEATSTRIFGGFWLKLPVFEAGALYLVEARIQFRLVEGRPTFTFLLHNKDVVLRDAFDEVRKRVHAETSLPIFAGRD